MKRLSPRICFASIALFCAASLGFALYLQNFAYVIPCPLCIFQRIGLIVCGILAMLASILPFSRQPKIWPSLIACSALIGAAVSIRHIQIQQTLATDAPQSCGASLDFMLQTNTLPAVVANVLAGHGDCTIIDWQLGFLTLPKLALIGYGCIFLIAIAAYFLSIQHQKTSE